MQATPSILKQAKWIWPEHPNWDLTNCYALFRHRFELNQVLEVAPLHITADQSYQLYINGSYVCRGPARGYQKTWPYDTVDVAEYLVDGPNLIAIRAHTPGFSNFQYIHQGFAGLLVAAEWGQTIIRTDRSWRMRRQAGIDRGMVPTSMQQFPQEQIDLRIEAHDWMQVEYDDSDWNASGSELAWNALPWESLQSRGIPMLDESLQPLGSVIGRAQGASAKDYLTTRNLSKTHFEEGLDHQPSDEASDSITFPPSPTDTWQSVLIDLGRTHVGSVQLQIEGNCGDEIIECHHYETLREGTLHPDYKPDAHCRMAFSNRLICSEVSTNYTFYHSFGFKYLILLVRNNRHAVTIRPQLRNTLYPHSVEGLFESSDATLNDIWKACVWTQKVCSLDAYVDTPYREQVQWWGDARVQAWNTFHMSGDTRLFSRGIDQIAAQTTHDGVTYGHAPTIAHNCVLPDFTLIWILTLWDYYWQTGSLEPFQKHQSTIQKALSYFAQWTDAETGLLRYDDRFWLFLDWTPLHKEGCSSVYSLWYLYALDRLNELYTLVEDPTSAKDCADKASALRAQLLKLSTPQGLIRDGYRSDGSIVSDTSVHTQTLAILNRLIPESEQNMLTQSILPEVTGASQSEVRPSSYWITYIYSLLSQRDYGAEVVDDIRRRWAQMAKYGTAWENFAPVKAVESFSHAWSAHPLFHLMQIIGGIQQTAPAWRSIRVQPCFIGDSAKVRIPTPQGIIETKWTRTEGVINGELHIPADIDASLVLPHETVSVTGSYTYSFNEPKSD